MDKEAKAKIKALDNTDAMLRSIPGYLWLQVIYRLGRKGDTRSNEFPTVSFFGKDYYVTP